MMKRDYYKTPLDHKINQIGIMSRYQDGMEQTKPFKRQKAKNP